MGKCVSARVVSSIVASWVGLFAAASYAANGTWYSTNVVYRNTYWTNSYNWTGLSFPAGNQVATFNNSVNTTNTTINVEGLAIISNIVFDTTAVAAYTIGSNGVSQQTLVLTNGSVIQLTSTALNSQRFDAMLQLGHERTNSSHTIRNDHAYNALTFAGNIMSLPNGLLTGSNAKTLTVAGIGPVTISGNITTNGYSPLTVTDNTLGYLLLPGSNTINTLNANGGPLTLTGTNRIYGLNVNSGLATLTAFNTIDSVTVSGGALALSGTNRVVGTIAVNGGTATVAGSNSLDTVTVTGGTLSINGTNRIATALNVNANLAVSLAGSNTVKTINFNGTGGAAVNVAAGRLSIMNTGGTTINAPQDCVINGPGVLFISMASGEDYGNNQVAAGKTCVINAKLTGATGFEHYPNNGTFVLTATNDFTQNVAINGSAGGTISFATVNNKNVPGNLGAGTALIFGSCQNGRYLYTGSGETTDRVLDIRTNGVFEVAGTGNFKFTSAVTNGAGLTGVRTLTLQGSADGTGEFAGQLRNTTGVLALTKWGSGAWYLSASNTYTGATRVNSGTLALTGALGALAASSSIVISNTATLLLSNTPSANNTNRLGDALAITLNGGTLSFTNAGGSANYSENLGAVTVNQSDSIVATAQAEAGRTATLRFASLARTQGATVNFTGAGLGADSRNRVFIAGQADGMIGPWAVVNGTNLAAYSSANGVYAASDPAFADIAARAPSTIVSNDASYVRINLPGEDGAITLDSPVTRIATLLQNTEIAATVDSAGKTFQTAAISVPAGKAAVTIGSAANDGVLSSVIPNGELALNNGSSNDLTVNAVIADNGASSKLTKYGNGTVTLAGSNTFSGSIAVYGGSLVLANSDALQNVTLSATGTVFGSAVESHAFNVANISGTVGVPLVDNAPTPNPVALTVGKNNANAFYGGVASGSGSLIKSGNGTLTLSGANTFLGGLTVGQGTVVASNAAALGVGGLVNNGTINLPLTATSFFYSGISNSMSGAGTVNVWLPSGSSTTFLNGDYSAFTGVWNVGTNAAAAWGKVQMNGPDNAAATLNLRPHSSAMIAGGTHYATANLHGGDTGESLGQLRVESNANWAGPVNLLAVITNTANNADAYFGANSGFGSISGVIDDLGAGYTVDKAGGGALSFYGANSYSGPTWIKAGVLSVPAIGDFGSGASPLGAPSSLENSVIKLGLLTSTNATLAYTGMGETTGRQIDLAGTASAGLLAHLGTNTLTFTSDIISSGAGPKRLTLLGLTNSVGVIAGVINNSYVTNALTLYKDGFGTWKLTRDNLFTGNVTINAGVLVITQSGSLGVSNKTIFAVNGTVGNPQLHLDGSAGDITLGTNIFFQTSNNTEGALRNLAGNNTVAGRINLTGGGGDTAVVSVDGTLTLSGQITTDYATVRNLRLRGNGNGEVSGAIDNGSSTIGLIRENGTGTWTLSGSNSYTTATLVNEGTLAVGGAKGFIASALTINPTGRFSVVNDSFANSINRLSDSSTLTLNGGTFDYFHTGGAVNYSETAGPLVANSNTSTVWTSQADETQTSVLTFASLARNGTAAIDFRGTGLGVDDRNKILFTTPPGTGLLGLWATYNTTSYAAYDPALGIVDASASYLRNLTAKGPATIEDDATLGARITSEGTEGPIALAGATTSSLKSLLQNCTTDSTVGMTNQTLLVDDLMIAAGQANLTLGTAQDEGLIMPLAAGGTLTLINQSDSTLTLNAAVTNNTSASKIIKQGNGLVKLNGRNAYTGTTLISNGTLEFGGGSTQSIAGAISGAGTLVKSGNGTLTLSGANTYTGPASIRQGILVAQNNAAFGNASTGTVVESGATLDVGGTMAANGLTIGAESFTVSGAGVNGMGAIVNNGSADQQNALSRITLVDNTIFGGGRRWDIRGSTPTLTMNGYDVTKVSTNFINFSATSVNPDGIGGTGDIDVQGGSFGMDGGARLNGSAANTMTVRGGAQLQMYNVSVATNTAPWTLNLDHNAMAAATQGAGNGTINTWSGPVNLSGTAILAGGNTGYSLTFSGPIAGVGGSLLKTGVAVAYLTSSNNTYDGSTVISNGTLYAAYAGSLPGYDAGKVTLAGGATLSLRTGDGETGWNSDQLKSLHDTSNITNNTAVLSIDTALSGLDYAGDLTKLLALTKQGANTLTLSGTNTFTGAVIVNGGTLAFGNVSTNLVGAVTVANGARLSTTNNSAITTGALTLNGSGVATFGGYGSNVIGNITLNNASSLAFNGPGFNTNGSLTVNNTGTVVYASGTTNNIGAIALNNLGLLTFANGSTSTVLNVTLKNSALMNVDGALSLRGNTLTVGNASGDRPTATVSTNVFMTRLYLGQNSGAAGAIIQNGGTVSIAPPTGSTDDLALGSAGGYGYYRLNAGVLNPGQFSVGGSGQGFCNAVLDVNAGVVTVGAASGWLLFNQGGGNAAVNLFGGTVIAPPSGNDTTLIYTNLYSAFGMINLLGPSATMDVAVGNTTRSLNMARAAGGLAAVVNLNAGTLHANRVYAQTQTGAALPTPTLLNFNGGTLRAGASTAYGATFLRGLTAATVYPGGASLDAQSNALVTVAQSLLAPTDYGVASVSLLSGGLGYIGAPAVVVSGGSGAGATAIASVDLNPESLTFGQVTGITVTSPGTGYLPGDVVVATLRGGGYTNNASALAYNAVLAPNSSNGGLAKLGSGTVVLSGTNTYGGATTVLDGTLIAAHNLAIPTGTGLQLSGGKLDLNGLTLTNDLLLAGGSIINGSLYSAQAAYAEAGTLNALLVSDAGLVKGGNGTLTISAPQTYAGSTFISNGTLRVMALTPGLYEGRVPNGGTSSLNTVSNNPATSVQLATRYANQYFADAAASGGIWPNYTTWIYSGYLWSDATTNETWSFVKRFDDCGLIKLNGSTILYSTVSSATMVTNAVVSPGANAFELRLGQGSGAVGINTAWTGLGIGYDRQGRGLGLYEYFKTLADPGNGSLLTVTNVAGLAADLLPTGTVVTVSASGAVLDLGGTRQSLAGLSGSGLVTNGTLTVTGAITPAGAGTLGTLTLATSSATLTGTLSLDVNATGGSDLLAVRGNVDLSSLTLSIANPASLDRHQQYTIMTCTGTRTGTFAANNLPNSRWHVMYLSDGTVKLFFVEGTLLKVR